MSPRLSLFADWNRQVAGLIQIAEAFVAEGTHHLPIHAAAMNEALRDAQMASNANDLPTALKALGAFANIQKGYIEEEPHYLGKESVRGAQAQHRLAVLGVDGHDLVRAANLTVYRGMSDQEALAEVRKATEKTE